MVIFKMPNPNDLIFIFHKILEFSQFYVYSIKKGRIYYIKCKLNK